MTSSSGSTTGTIGIDDTDTERHVQGFADHRRRQEPSSEALAGLGGEQGSDHRGPAPDDRRQQAQEQVAAYTAPAVRSRSGKRLPPPRPVTRDMAEQHISREGQLRLATTIVRSCSSPSRPAGRAWCRDALCRERLPSPSQGRNAEQTPGHKRRRWSRTLPAWSRHRPTVERPNPRNPPMTNGFPGGPG